MATSSVQICNMALTELGSQRIVNIETDNTTTSNRCLAIYDTLRDEMLAAHHGTLH